MAIRIKGETYRDAAELAETIERLGNDYAEMPEGAAKTNLAAHIDELYSVLGGYAPGGDGKGDGGDKAGKVSTASSSSSTTDEPENDDDDALAEGAQFTCPMCGGTGELPHEPPPDPRSARCPDCEGWGKVYTGSLVEGHTVRDCHTCQGQGWVDRSGERAAQPDVNKTAADMPEQMGALWDAKRKFWMPPAGQQPPWPGATWDTYYGKWS